MLPVVMLDQMQVHLRAAKPNDWNGIARLLDETWHESYDRTLGRLRVSLIVKSLATLRPLLSDPSLGMTFPIVVAEVDDKIVGVANAGWSRSHEASIMWMLYILPSHQNLGIGKELMENTLSRLPAAAQTQLQVLPDNHRAIRFDERNGFQRARTSFHMWTCTRVLNMARNRAACGGDKNDGYSGRLSGHCDWPERDRS